jgi:hypothetical protein
VIDFCIENVSHVGTFGVRIVETDPVGSFIVFLGFDSSLVVRVLDVNERTVPS